MISVREISWIYLCCICSTLSPILANAKSKSILNHTIRQCGPEDFRCTKNVNDCVPKKWRCDGKEDCKDGSDELHCESSTECQHEGWHKCLNGRCIPEMWRCDGDNDCEDLSDERGCDLGRSSSSGGLPQIAVEVTCSASDFTCRTGNQCILMSWVCDGQADCKDASDETQGCANRKCMPGEVRCGRSNQCIPERWRCDGSTDCANSWDEKDCDSCANPENKYRCHGDSYRSQCVSLSQVCDGAAQCDDGSDEGGRCNETDCRSNPCGGSSFSSKCHNTPEGYRCNCNNGYEKIPESNTCRDIDECASADVTCSQACTNSPGSYACQCVEGYHLEPDQRTCKALGPEPVLIFSARSEIRAYQLRTKQYYPVQRHLSNAVALDYDLVGERIYWSDIAEESIMSSRGDGTDVSTVIHAGLRSTEGISVDHIARNIYITDSLLRMIIACRLDGSMCTVIFDTGISKPRDILVQPQSGRMYWTDWSEPSGKIERSNMDGSDRGILVYENVGWPNGLTIDHGTNILYWVDAELDKVECVTLPETGWAVTNRRELLQGELSHPYSIAVFESTLYWTDWQLGSVQMASKLDGKMHETLVKQMLQPTSVKIMHPLLKESGYNPCIEMSCSHMCLIKSPTEATCHCPRGMTLDAHGLTCHGSEEVPHLLVAQQDALYRVYPQSIGGGAVSEQLQVSGLVDVGAVTYDHYKGRIIYSDVALDRIVAVDVFNTSNSSVLVGAGAPPGSTTHDLDTVDSVSVDGISDNLYWIDSGRARIECCQLRDECAHVIELLTAPVLSKPRSLVLHPTRGVMFYSDWARTSSRIDRADMSGEQRQVLVDTDLMWPSSLTIDYAHDKLLWADLQLDVIDYISIDGTGRGRILQDLHHPYSVLLYSPDVLLWSDWTTQSLHAYNVSKKEHLKPLLTQHSRLMDITLVNHTGSLHQEGGNGCSRDNGGCSHFCLPTSSEQFVCRCPVGMALYAPRSECVPEPRCDTRTEFSCDSGECVHLSMRCNGVPDECADGSDELYCDSSCAEFTCHNGQCVQKSFRCDGDLDCRDGSDELHCNQTHAEVDAGCDSDEHSCTSGGCIPSFWVCDGTSDCADQSDESPAQCLQVECAAQHEYQCRSGQCIPASWRCDGDTDCYDKSDELHCGGDNRKVANAVTCSEGEFRCDSQLQCVPAEVRCNQLEECDDGSDEKDCATVLPSSKSVDEPVPCTHGYYQCKVGPCIPSTWLCDGKEDCPDGDDETRSCLNITCRPSEFQCANRELCIPPTWLCDGYDDCGDQSDESHHMCRGGGGGAGSANYSPLHHHTGIVCDDSDGVRKFQCLVSGECIPLSAVCNGAADCTDTSDEGPHCATVCHPPNNGGCSHQCVATPQHAICTCPPGYTLMDNGKICSDIDECSLNEDDCNQLCVNTKGSYRCRCVDGYSMTSDRHHCKPTSSSGMLMFSTGSAVRYIQLGDTTNAGIVHQATSSGLPSEVAEQQRQEDGEIRSNPPADYHFITAIDFTIKPTLLYYVDATQGVLVEVNTLTKESTVLVTEMQSSPKSLSIDWLALNVYYSAPRRAAIVVCSLTARHPVDGKLMCANLISGSSIHQPTAVVTHPARGLLFWSDWGDHPKIEMVNLDGSERQDVASKGVVWPIALTVDPVLDDLYWVDAMLHLIECMNIYGRNRRTVVSSNIHEPFGLVVFNDWLYWSQRDSQAGIVRVNKFTGDNATVMYEGGGGGARHAQDVSRDESRTESHADAESQVESQLVLGVTVVHPLRQHVFPEVTGVFSNPCGGEVEGGRRGGCSHLCLLKPSGGHRCACPDGYIMDQHSRTTCSKIPSDVLSAHGMPSDVTSLTDGAYQDSADMEYCPDDFCINSGTCVVTVTEESIVRSCRCAVQFAGVRCEVALSGDVSGEPLVVRDAGPVPVSEDEESDHSWIAAVVCAVVVLGVLAVVLYRYWQKQRDLKMEYVQAPGTSRGDDDEERDGTQHGGNMGGKSFSFHNPVFDLENKADGYETVNYPHKSSNIDIVYNRQYQSCVPRKNGSAAAAPGASYKRNMSDTVLNDACKDMNGFDSNGVRSESFDSAFHTSNTTFDTSSQKCAGSSSTIGGDDVESGTTSSSPYENLTVAGSTSNGKSPAARRSGKSTLLSESSRRFLLNRKNSIPEGEYVNCPGAGAGVEDETGSTASHGEQSDSTADLDRRSSVASRTPLLP